MILMRLRFVETTALPLFNQKHPRFNKKGKKTLKISKTLVLKNDRHWCNFLNVRLNLTNNIFKLYKKKQKVR